jgi:hypothetical protein
VGRPIRAGPDTVPQGDEGIEVATDMTEPGRGKEAVDMMDVHAGLPRSSVQNLHEPSQSQDGHFPAPQHFYASQYQVFKADRVINGTQLVCKLPMPRLTLVGSLVMEPCQGLACLPSMSRSPLCAYQGAASLAYAAQRLSEGLWRRPRRTITAGVS